MRWNNCRVPFACPAVCDRYVDIFDLDGNVRDPANPWNLSKLLKLMQAILKLTDVNRINEPTNNAIRADLCRSKKRDGGHMKIERSLKVASEQMPNSSAARRLKASKKEEDSKEEHVLDAEIPTNGSPLNASSRVATPLNATSHGAYPMRVFGERAHRLLASDLLLTDRKGRRHGHGSPQLDNLRSEQHRILNEIFRNLSRMDPERFLEALTGADLTEEDAKLMKGEKVNVSVKDVSAFYTKVVAGSDKIEQLKEAKQTGRPIRERRYFGEPLPVVFHAPYDPNNQATWLRRHPDQLRLQPDGRLGMSSVQHYRRDSVLKALKIASERYSIHSLNNLKVERTRTALQHKSEYQRVFRPSSGRHPKKLKSEH
ncbi:uncharacterized protein LOC6570230 [Drosophila grimshawi]|nr:uncharacterized protein LOC6570230 [Drosophila grimshawi]